MEKDTDFEDYIGLAAVVLFFISFGGFGGMAFLEPVRKWALNARVIVEGPTVVVPLPGDPTIGLDGGRTVLLAGVLFVLILGGVYAVVKRHQRRTQVD